MSYLKGPKDAREKQPNLILTLSFSTAGVHLRLRRILDLLGLETSSYPKEFQLNGNTV